MADFRVEPLLPLNSAAATVEAAENAAALQQQVAKLCRKMDLNENLLADLKTCLETTVDEERNIPMRAFVAKCLGQVL